MQNGSAEGHRQGKSTRLVNEKTSWITHLAGPRVWKAYTPTIRTASAEKPAEVLSRRFSRGDAKGPQAREKMLSPADRRRNAQQDVAGTENKRAQ